MHFLQCYSLFNRDTLFEPGKSCWYTPKSLLKFHQLTVYVCVFLCSVDHRFYAYWFLKEMSKIFSKFMPFLHKTSLNLHVS